MAELKLVPKSLKDSEKSGIVLVAPSKEGKTVAALTLSQQLDPTWSKPQSISDLGYVTFDVDALRGPKLMGLEGIEHWYDMTDYAGEGLKVIDDALNAVAAKMAELAKEKKICGVVWDTMTMLDENWKSYLVKSYEKWALSDQLNAKHRNFLMEKVMKIPCTQVFLMHTKKLSGEMDAAKRESLGIEADTKSVMGLSAWDGPKLYRAQCSYIVPVKKVEQKGKPDEFFFYPRGVDGIEAGGRYGRSGAPDRLPANLRTFLGIVNGTQKAA